MNEAVDVGPMKPICAIELEKSAKNKALVRLGTLNVEFKLNLTYP